jgi:hypothetical protein
VSSPRSSSSPTGSSRSCGRWASRCGAAAGRHLRVRLPVQDGVVHAEPARPHGGRPLRLHAAARRGRQVPPEGRHRPRAGRSPPLQAGALPRGGHRAARLHGGALRARPGVRRTSRAASTGPWRPSSIGAIGVLLAGWSSANKYSLMGGLRAAGQLIAYELPMILAVIGVVIQAGTMNMQGIVYAQADGAIFGFEGLGNPYILTQFLGFAIFMIAVQAELARPPSTCPSPSPSSSPATSPSTPACGSCSSSSASSPPPVPSPPSAPPSSSAAGRCPPRGPTSTATCSTCWGRSSCSTKMMILGGTHLLRALHVPPVP